MFRIQQLAMAALVTVALAAPAAAQQQNYSPVSSTDIQRLQETVSQAAVDVQQLRSRDASRATQLQSQLDDLRDEVIYLKVKLRKDGTLARAEYASVRDGLDAHADCPSSILGSSPPTTMSVARFTTMNTIATRSTPPWTTT